MIGQTIGHYTILAKLGAGAMGEVYKARHNRLHRFVAIKALPEDRSADPDRRRRLVQEAQAASALQHANIVVIHDILSLDGRDLLVMEFIEGKTLDHVIPSGGFDLKSALKYAIPIASALAAAQTAGIVHRDLKPANVMVGDDGSVKLLDFGLAKLIPPFQADDVTGTINMQTQEGMILGTVAYMSPEQAAGKLVDCRSDIFAFGAVLYEMLTGRRAFEAESTMLTLMAVIGREPRGLRTLAPGIPSEMESIVARCLRKDPVERYQNAGELKAALENVGSPEIRAAAAGAAAAIEAPSIAVLPFANLSADKENEYFSDGLAEEIVSALARLPGLRVASRTSAFAFRGKDQDISQIAQALRVAHVLEGSVRRAGNRIRVSAQLIGAGGGFQLWSERYDREMSDVFAIQDEISQAIVSTLRVKLAGSAGPRQTQNVEAYNLYLKGRHLLRKFTLDGNTKARALFAQALELDPDYALARVGLAICDLASGVFGWASPRDAMEKSRPVFEEALRSDDSVVEAHWAYGTLLALFDYDWAKAEREFKRALELDPDSAQAHWTYGSYLLPALGRLDEAFVHVRRAVELDPLALHYPVALGHLHRNRGEYELAIEQLHAVIAMDSTFYVAHLLLGSTYSLKGMFQEAVAETEWAAELTGRIPWVLGFLGAVYALAGRRREALELISELERRALSEYVSPAAFAWIYVALKEYDEAFAWWGKAVDAHDPAAIWLPADPALNGLRIDPRYEGLLARMRLGLNAARWNKL